MNGSKIPAPGADAADRLGILSIIAALLGVFWLAAFFPDWPRTAWLGFGLAAVIAFAGIGQFVRAWRIARRTPDAYAKPEWLSLRLNLWGLILDSLLLAIFIPAIWMNMVAARDHYTLGEAIKTPEAALLEAYPRIARTSRSHNDLLNGLESILRQQNAKSLNAWDHQQPVVNPHLEEVMGERPEAMEDLARNKATQLGQGVFLIELPTEKRPGYLAMAARYKSGRHETGTPDSKIGSQVVELPFVAP